MMTKIMLQSSKNDHHPRNMILLPFGSIILFFGLGLTIDSSFVQSFAVLNYNGNNHDSLNIRRRMTPRRRLFHDFLFSSSTSLLSSSKNHPKKFHDFLFSSSTSLLSSSKNHPKLRMDYESPYDSQNLVKKINIRLTADNNRKESTNPRHAFQTVRSRRIVSSISLRQQQQHKKHQQQHQLQQQQKIDHQQLTDDGSIFQRNDDHSNMNDIGTSSKAVEEEMRQLSLHGMPWNQSICSDYMEPALFYMPFYTSQIQYMKETLTNLRQLRVVSSKKQQQNNDMSYNLSKDGTARIYTAYYSSDEYKLIRLTVLDGGNKLQVFTSLWYPNELLNVPLFGIDLLQFNHGKKLVCISDFQPLHTNEEDHDVSYEHVIEPIRTQYKLLQNAITNRFYNANDTHFSNNMLYGKHNYFDSSNTNDKDTVSTTTTNPTHDSANIGNSGADMVYNEMFPAVQSYMKVHVDMVQKQYRKQLEQQQQIDDESYQTKIQLIREKHAAYDTYSAARDPAHALLGKMFGQQWADDYVYDILFPLSTPETDEV